MTSLWPWLAVAGVGALHGLNPAAGWIGAAACGVRGRDRAQVLRALLPIALGHIASIAVVAGTVAVGLWLERTTLQLVAGAAFGAIVIAHRFGRTAWRARVSPGPAALALGSFVMSTAHGAGMMLVPGLIPLCLGNAPGGAITASGSLPLALAAVGVHTAAMLGVTGTMASVVCRGVDLGAAWIRKRGRRLSMGSGHAVRSPGPRRPASRSGRSRAPVPPS